MTKRGAFEGPELSSVGTLRDMLLADAELLAKSEHEEAKANTEAEIRAHEAAKVPGRKVLGRATAAA